jgi:hypothetical protein
MRAQIASIDRALAEAAKAREEAAKTREEAIRISSAEIARIQAETEKLRRETRWESLRLLIQAMGAVALIFGAALALVKYLQTP